MRIEFSRIHMALTATIPDPQKLKCAEGWLELGDWNSANDELERFEPLQQAHPAVLALRVRIYAQAKRWREALVVGSAIIQWDDPEMLLAMAKSACALQNVSLARIWIKRAIDLQPFPDFKRRALEDPELVQIWRSST